MVWANPPPPLAIPSPRPRSSSADSETSSETSSPVLSSLDSSSALILVHDSEDSNIPFDFSSDDEDDDNSPQFEVRRALIPPLGPSVVFLYLLSPYLKLGALFLPHTLLPLKYRLPLFLAFAGSSAFARHIWYMLARYMRTADLEDVVLDAFARGRGKERRRSILRSTVRAGTGTFRVLLATVYLRRAAHTLLPLLPNSLPISPQIVSTIILSLVIFPLMLAPSLASTRVVYATWLSLVTYVAWLGCVINAHAHGTLRSSSDWLRPGIFWEGITIIAFAFTTSSTLPLYASLKGTTQAVTTVKTPRTRSFKILSALSVFVAILLTLPLILFSARLNDPETFTSFPSVAMEVLNATTLILGIPSIIVTTPPLPIPERIRHASTIPISKTLQYIFIVVLALLPEWVSGILNDAILVSALYSTYFLPATVHIVAHFFKAPLAIVVPQTFPPPALADDGFGSGSRSPQSGRLDELLLRKERALQKKQFKKRIVWDVGVWGMFAGGGAVLVWAVGRLARRW